MTDRDYVLGTHDEEITRLGLQHRVWRARAMDAWRRAGIGPGQTVIDLGCGPGFATIDLAELVGPAGRVLAVDRSRRFLDVLLREADARGLSHITTLEADLDEVDLSGIGADAVWCRWVIAFVHEPRALIERVHAALKPGGRFVSHEYLDYGTWRMAPTLDALDDFVREVIASWRAAGGEPNVGLELPTWLEAHGFEIRELRPSLDLIAPADQVWQWPRSFIESGLRRLTSLGRLTPERAEAIWQTFVEREAAPSVRMVTPAMLETVAEKR